MTDRADAPRLRRPGWKDPRLMVGVLLVLVSVAAVVLLVRQADSRGEYWAAAQDITPGSALKAEHLTVVSANLGDSSQSYLPADQPVPDNVAAVATVRQGELLPAGGLAARDPEERQQITVQVSDVLPEHLSNGDRVDLWVAFPDDTGRGFFEPELVAVSAEVVGTSESTTAFGAGVTGNVALMLGPEEVPEILGAQANGARMTIVPSLGSS